MKPYDHAPGAKRFKLICLLLFVVLITFTILLLSACTKPAPRYCYRCTLTNGPKVKDLGIDCNLTEQEGRSKERAGDTVRRIVNAGSGEVSEEYFNKIDCVRTTPK